jgi:hypothetical protein
VTVVGLDGAPPNFDDSWSLVISFDGEPNIELEQHVLIRFLSPNAPHDWLKPGRLFQLYEGNRLVAYGEVQED